MPGINEHVVSRASNSTRTGIPAVWMRAGTWKGLFIHEHGLPSSRDRWAPILHSALGSAETDKRQLSRVGGATSTTSKVAITRKSAIPGVGVDYTFIQIAPDQAQVDTTGKCGNTASGWTPQCLTPNTQQILVETVHVISDGKFSEDGDYSIAGLEAPLKSPFCIQVDASLGQPHPSLQLTGAVCLGTVLSIPGTVARDLRRQEDANDEHNVSPKWQVMAMNPTMKTVKWSLKHPSGLMDVEAKLETHENGETSVESVSVFPTARRLFERKFSSPIITGRGSDWMILR
ncbi:hypothetical protein BDV36DRAFT_294039 [Aspergillus pseudocaelatus]|uniref:Uncharacterized protein n=1 Tax=Aspergillus pseudocaelatus TaxID=1825620 RepID=A0ABQ6WRJ7_9EURO|nr:hypothetical protein BDV36DRAFT_294039 [Aspergillus pseudocaelatus]